MSFDHATQVAADLTGVRWTATYNIILTAVTGATMVGLGVFTAWSPLWGLLLLSMSMTSKINVGAPPPER
jgi:hypothetical protein